MVPLQICIAGNLGSGKTTVAKLIAEGLGLRYEPAAPPDQSYLVDLFGDPGRWAFEVQTALLVRKATAISEAISAGIDTVVDRSIYEDIQVFAAHFKKNGHLTERSHENYRRLASLLVRHLPDPTFVIFCQLPPDLCWARLHSRPARAFESLYPPDHLLQLDTLYTQWLHSFDRCPVFVLDTSQIDLRGSSKEVLLEDLRTILSSGLRPSSGGQLQLFGDAAFQDPPKLRCLSLETRGRGLAPQRQQRSLPRMALPGEPFVYLAAPFTGMATPGTKANDLLGEKPGRPILGPGLFRDALRDTEKAFNRLGLLAVVPHRDVSGWGRRRLEPQDIVEWCSIQVRHASLVCALPINSVGVHFEIGLAQAWQKPCVILENRDGSDSTISKGLQSGPALLRLSYDTLQDIPGLLLGPECRAFLRRLGLV